MATGIRTCSYCGVRFMPYTPGPASAGGENAPPPLCHACRRHARTDGRQMALVLWFRARAGFGMLRSEAGDRVYCHRSQLQAGRRLQAGDLVLMECVKGRRGLEARSVSRVAGRKTLDRQRNRLASESPAQG